MTKTSRHPVAHHRVSHGLAHHKTRPGCLGRPWRVRGQCVYDEAALPGPRSATHDDTKVLTAPQTRGSRQHGAPRRRPNQADSVSRPLRRRAPKMARPARVRMRRRNPWVRARRRLFGWKVRLPLLTAQNLLVSTSSRPSSGVSCRRTAVCGVSYQRVVPSLLATTNKGTQNSPIAGGRPYEGTHPLQGLRNRPLDHAPRQARHGRVPPVRSPNGNTPCAVKCSPTRTSCGRAQGLLTCLSRTYRSPCTEQSVPVVLYERRCRGSGGLDRVR
jgi:hypothetical protein